MVTVRERDPRRGPRRRGAALEEAILRAAFDELAEHGYADMTMDRVAARAVHVRRQQRRKAKSPSLDRPLAVTIVPTWHRDGAADHGKTDSERRSWPGAAT